MALIQLDPHRGFTWDASTTTDSQYANALTSSLWGERYSLPFDLPTQFQNRQFATTRLSATGLKDQLRQVERISAEVQSAEHASWLTQLEQLNREWFIKCEDILHREAVGPVWMRDGRVADKVAENLHQLDGDAYRLDAFSVMSNHVHTVFRPLVSSELMEEILRSLDDSLARIPALSKIMHTLKGRSARECNLILGRSGSFWEHESFDHVIRNGKFDKTIRYVLNNPVKIGVVRNWEDYRWNYCRKEWIERFRDN